MKATATTCAAARSSCDRSHRQSHRKVTSAVVAATAAVVTILIQPKVPCVTSFALTPYRFVNKRSAASSQPPPSTPTRTLWRRWTTTTTTTTTTTKTRRRAPQTICGWFGNNDDEDDVLRTKGVKAPKLTPDQDAALRQFGPTAVQKHGYSWFRRSDCLDDARQSFPILSDLTDEEIVAAYLTQRPGWVDVFVQTPVGLFLVVNLILYAVGFSWCDTPFGNADACARL